MRQQPTKRFKMIELRRHDRDLGIDKDKELNTEEKEEMFFLLAKKIDKDKGRG